MASLHNFPAQITFENMQSAQTIREFGIAKQKFEYSAFLADTLNTRFISSERI